MSKPKTRINIQMSPTTNPFWDNVTFKTFEVDDPQSARDTIQAMADYMGEVVRVTYPFNDVVHPSQLNGNYFNPKPK